MRKRTIAKRIAESLAGKTPSGQGARREELRRAGVDAERLAEYESLLRSVDEMDVPEPSAEMHRKFQALLEDAKKAQFIKARSAARPPRPFAWLHPGLFPRLAMALCLIVVGWFLGYQVTPRPERARLDLLASEVREMKKTIMLSKLENPSAGERMQAIQFAQDLSGPDEAVIASLVQTMNGDPNVNVRLVAVEALARFAGRPRVREALIQSIVRQESPLIQLALAEVMLALHEKRAVEAFRRVIADPQLDYWVKSKLEDTVRQLL
jgi:hypothetical protein